MTDFKAEMSVTIPDEVDGPIWRVSDNTKFTKAKDGYWSSGDEAEFGALTWADMIKTYGPFTDEVTILAGERLNANNFSYLSTGAIFAADDEDPWIKTAKNKVTQGETTVTTTTFTEDYLTDTSKEYKVLRP